MGKNICVALNKRNRSESSTLAKHVWQSFYFLAMLDIIVWSSSVCVSSLDLVGPAADALFPLILCEQVLYQVFSPKLVYSLDTMSMFHFTMTQTVITFQQALPQLCLSIEWLAFSFHGPPYTSYKLVSYLDNTWTIFSLVDRKIRRRFSCL